ncbi:MAG: DNA-3-methyladenine glycosylase 2 family protein [Oscillospiraceae bacterium]|nr:DNA-3-methyladenine glycosylase 2 family protein [Oscillospiraceae bacterium]
MRYIEHDFGVEVIEVDEFNLAKTFECGQCFRWNKDKNGDYVGVAFGHAARLRYGGLGGGGGGDGSKGVGSGGGGSGVGSGGSSVFITCSVEDFESIWRAYFDLDRDYAKIRSALSIDEYMQNAAEYGAGIRILRQERWEALCSFIVSQNNNIPRIKKVIDSLCRLYGEKVSFLGEELYTFPSAERLAKLDENDLAPLRCGYRASYIIGAARAVAAGKPDLDELALCSPEQAAKELMKLRGVGVKVASCAILYGLHKLDAFPVDTWMRRAVNEQYGAGFDPSVFSPYAGIAQQYIYHYSRNRQ